MRRRHDGVETFAPAPLFDARPEAMSGRTDPDTSRQAAARMVESGALGRHQQWALDLVRTFPGSTCPELANRAGDNIIDGDVERLRQQCGRRLNELEKAGLIYREGTREGCSLWWPTNERAEVAASAQGGRSDVRTRE